MTDDLADLGAEVEAVQAVVDNSIHVNGDLLISSFSIVAALAPLLRAGKEAIGKAEAVDGQTFAMIVNERDAGRRRIAKLEAALERVRNMPGPTYPFLDEEGKDEQLSGHQLADRRPSRKVQGQP